MDYEIIRIAAAILGTAIAAWQDHKTSFIDDKIVYAMIGLGAILNMLTLDTAFITYSIGTALVIGALGFFMYRTGQLGGGDVLLFAGIQLLLPNYPTTTATLGYAPTQYLFMPFFLSVLAASSFYALWGTMLNYANQLRKTRPKPDLPSAIISFAALGIALYLFYSVGANIGSTLLVFVMIIPGLFLFTFKQQITDELIIKKIRISQVEDEDILATEKLPASLVKKYSLGRVLTKSEVEKLRVIEKKEKLHSFPVYKNLPRFGPYILAGLLTSLLVGDLFVFLMLAF